MTTALAPTPTKTAQQRRRSTNRARSLGSRSGNTIAGIAAWAIGILFVFPVFYMNRRHAIAQSENSSPCRWSSGEPVKVPRATCSQ